MRWRLLAATALMLPCAAFAQAPSTGPLDWRNVGTSGAAIPLLNGNNAWSAPQTFTASGLFVHDIWANNYGSCTWGTAGGNDVGPCINAAIAAAAAAGGGTVRIPAGVFNDATPTAQSSSYVHVVGDGVGVSRDNFAPSVFQSGTRLVWTGSAGATMFDLEPTGSESMYKADVVGIVFDCNSIASTCFKMSQVSASMIDVGWSEPVSIGANITTQVISDAPGTQHNFFKLGGRCLSASLSATCLLINGGTGSNWNVSFNTFIDIGVWYNNGDGIVIGYADNNFYNIITNAHLGSGAGKAVVFASANYVMPNGLSTAGSSAQDETVEHASTAILVQGSYGGATVTRGSGNVGTAVFGSTTLTGGSTLQGNPTMTFGSTSGVVAGEAANCSQNGVFTGNSVSYTTGTTVVLVWPAFGTVASGVSCTFGWNPTITAVPGTYTITAASSTTFNITAPTGGNTQSAVALSGGIVSFTDMLVPLTGTVTTGDTWTVVVPIPSKDIRILGVDKNNSVANPTWENGANGFYQGTNAQFPQIVGYNQSINLGNGSVGATSNGQINIGFGVGSVNANGGINIGGAGNSVGCFYGVDIGGHNNICTGPYNAVIGGEDFTDRGDSIGPSYSPLAASAVGQMQMRSTVMGASIANATATRLTTYVGTLSGTSGLSIPVSTHTMVTIMGVTCRDTTTTGNYASWAFGQGDIDRVASTPSYAGTYSTATTPTRNVGMSTWTLTVLADTTYNSLGLLVTPATGNTDTVHCDSYPVSLEVQ